MRYEENTLKTSRSFVLAKTTAEGTLFLDSLGRWEPRVQYAFPYEKFEDAEKVASRRGVLVYERTTTTATTYTVTECAKP